ncbi:MAG: zinc-ribbon domain-containing protein [Rikenellaceae bacterium]
MSYCIKCGANLDAEAKFCATCGNPVGQPQQEKSEPSVDDQEVLLKKAANLFRNSESVGGRIFFYSNRLLFKSHSINIQTGETTIYYKDIKSLHKVNTLGLVPNGMLVKLHNGMEHQFVVWGRTKLIEFIYDIMKSI